MRTVALADEEEDLLILVHHEAKGGEIERDEVYNFIAMAFKHKFGGYLHKIGFFLNRKSPYVLISQSSLIS